MRYPESEKLEIIRIIERSHLPAKQTLNRLGLARPTFYHWYNLYKRFDEDALKVIGGQLLPHTHGAQPDHQPELYRNQGRQ